MTDDDVGFLRRLLETRFSRLEEKLDAVASLYAVRVATNETRIDELIRRLASAEVVIERHQDRLQKLWVQVAILGSAAAGGGFAAGWFS